MEQRAEFRRMQTESVQNSGTAVPADQGFGNREPKYVLFIVAGASLSLEKGHCCKLSALNMQQFSIRNMHFPWVLTHS